MQPTVLQPSEQLGPGLRAGAVRSRVAWWLCPGFLLSQVGVWFLSLLIRNQGLLGFVDGALALRWFGWLSVLAPAPLFLVSIALRFKVQTQTRERAFYGTWIAFSLIMLAVSAASAAVGLIVLGMSSFSP